MLTASRLLSLLLLLLISFPFTALAQRPGKRYALVIGVNEYREGQPLPALPYAETDAEGLNSVLSDGGYEVTLLTQSVGGQKGKYDQLPTAANIRDKLARLAANPFLDKQDTLLVALAGHGVLLRVRVDAKKTVEERFFYCPMDADVATVVNAAKDETEKDPTKRYFTLAEVRKSHGLVSVDEIYASLGEGCKAGLKLMLVDACRNDPTRSDGKRALESVTLPPLAPPPGGVGAFFSCSKNQKAQEDKSLKHGVFFHFVIEGLKGEADFTKDGKVTWSELNEYVGGSTYDYVFKKYGAKQSPDQMGQIQGNADLVSIGSSEPKALSVITNSIGQKLAYIPAGKFTMGSPEDEKDRGDDEEQVAVELTKGFYLGQTEVTQGQWKAVMGTEPWKGHFLVKEGANFPATYVSWDDAQAFCVKLSKSEGKAYRLPTEAQWEYACRGGTKTAYSFGADESKLGNYAWFTENAWDIGEQYAHVVGQKLPNPFGLYDMHGNVWEWCRDDYDNQLVGGTEPYVEGEGKGRVLRGGSWSSGSWKNRSSFRSCLTPGCPYDDFGGFRISRNP